MNEKFNELIALVPAADCPIDWDRIAKSPLAPYLKKMSETPQNPKWHGEGDVLTHTQMVCESLVALDRYRRLERPRQQILFLAALLHDIAKPACTRVQGGELVSPNHSAIGDRMARALFYKEFAIGGTRELQQFRETVCALIKSHTAPLHLHYEKSPDRKAIRIASRGDLLTHFSNDLLSILAEADLKGRVADDTEDKLLHVEFFTEVSKEAKCLYGPWDFPSAFSRFAYLSGRSVLPGQALYNDTWGTVLLLSGLPGAGKDTYIQKNHADLPMISLDVLRKEMKISPVGPQDRVVSAALEKAKGYLREKRSFVWNATNVSTIYREKLIRLFTNYNAMTKIVFLETSWDETLKRNRARKEAVPESVIEDMLRKMIPPTPVEAHEIAWILTT